MSGKLLCVLLALCLAQAYSAPKQGSVQRAVFITDALVVLKALLKVAEELVNNLDRQVNYLGAEILAQALIDAAVDQAEYAVSLAGPCGEAAFPEIEKLKTDAVNGISACLYPEFSDADKVIDEVKTLLPELEALIDAVEKKIEWPCKAIGGLGADKCLLEVGIEEAPKVKTEIDKLTTLISDLVAAEAKLEICIGTNIQKLEADLDVIVLDVEKNCVANGGLKKH